MTIQFTEADRPVVTEVNPYLDAVRAFAEKPDKVCLFPIPFNDGDSDEKAINRARRLLTNAGNIIGRTVRLETYTDTVGTGKDKNEVTMGRFWVLDKKIERPRKDTNDNTNDNLQE